MITFQVLNAFNRSGADEGGDDRAAESPAADVEEGFMAMYDLLLERLRDKGLLDGLRHQRNQNGHTPLTLAAAQGSLAFFDHLFQKEVLQQRFQLSCR